VKDAVVAGTARQNFGILDVGPQQVDISLYSRNRVEMSRTIFRQTWLP